MPGSIFAKVRKIQSQENNIFLQEPEQLENVSSQTFKMRPLSLINYKINILGLDFFFNYKNTAGTLERETTPEPSRTTQALPQTKRFYKNTDSV